MVSYVLRRLVASCLTIFVATLVLYTLVDLMPGDPAQIMLGVDAADPIKLQAARHQLGLDKPFLARYCDWFLNALTGNLGNSLQSGQPVAGIVMERFLFTLEFTLYCLAIALCISLPAAFLSIRFNESHVCRMITRIMSSIGLATPEFVWGLVLLSLGWASLGKIPSLFHSPVENLTKLFAPAICVGIVVGTAVFKMARSSMLQIMEAPYISTARAKGLAENVVIERHVFRNGMIPTITFIGIEFGYLLSGVVVTETLFALPGMGRLLLQSVSQRDYPVVLAVASLVTVLFTVANLMVDVLCGILDPRIRYT